VANAGLVRISKVTAPSSLDLTTLATVKTELGITDNTKDAQLARYITAASIAAEQFCNRDFVVETVEDDFWPQRDSYPRPVTGGLGPLQLSQWPIVSITSVVENAITLTLGTDFVVDATNGQLTRLDGNSYPTYWPTVPIAVVYSAGYSSIPADIEDAVIRMVRNRWFAKGRDPLVRQQTVPGVLEQTFWVPTGTDAGNMTADVEDILSNYRPSVFAT
jgi:hypothetical protein